MSEIKYVKAPIKFLIDSGLLFEINRQILHPLGLAMAVVTDESEDTETGQIMIWDARDEKEGVLYEPSTFVHGVEKINAFLESFALQKLEERKEEVGFVTQEHPDPYMKRDGVPLVTYNPMHDPEDKDSPDLVGFRVPYAWLESEVRSWYDYDINEFLDTYTYDHTEPLYTEAKTQGVLIEEELLRDAR
jgi:hypothetical protein